MSMQRRTFMSVLTGATLAGAWGIAIAGGGRKRRRVYCPPPVYEVPPGICPIYPWMNYGTYCSYYAVQCDAQNNMQAVNYDGACGLTSYSPCADCSLSGFMAAGAGHSVDPSFGNGYPGGAYLGAGTEIPDGPVPVMTGDPLHPGPVDVYHESDPRAHISKVIVASISGTDRYFQIVTAKIGPVHTGPHMLHIDEVKHKKFLVKITAHVGHEIAMVSTPDRGTDVTLGGGAPGVRLISFDGIKYTVLLKA